MCQPDQRRTELTPRIPQYPRSPSIYLSASVVVYSSYGEIKLVSHRYLPDNSSCLSRAFTIAAHNLHLIGVDGSLIVEFESNVFNQEGPNFVAETVSVEMTL